MAPIQSDRSSSRTAVADAVVERERVWLVPYAVHSSDSAGRQHDEPPHRFRGPYEVDRDRVLRSSAYRRLSHKTQVFTGEFGDYHRSRLTHTLEVVSFARALGRALRLNEDLIEALALIHDLGHPPFGHAGEAVLNECLKSEGGFCHNRHALRIVEILERCDRRFGGLNLSREVLDGQRARFETVEDGRQQPLEIQVVEAADSVAYDTHDCDDALELGLVSLDELLDLSLWREAARRAVARHEQLATNERRQAILAELIEWQLEDLLEQAAGRIDAREIRSVEDVRRAGPVIAASDDLAQGKEALEQFLHERVYRHPQVLESRERAQNVLRELFALFRSDPQLMPRRFQQRADEIGLARSVGDYLAGMTDRYAYKQFQRLAR